MKIVVVMEVVVVVIVVMLVSLVVVIVVLVIITKLSPNTAELSVFLLSDVPVYLTGAWHGL